MMCLSQKPSTDNGLRYWDDWERGYGTPGKKGKKGKEDDSLNPYIMQSMAALDLLSIPTKSKMQAAGTEPGWRFAPTETHFELY